MPNINDIKKHNKQFEDEFYRALGKFNVFYEQVMHDIGMVIHNTLVFRYGLKGEIAWTVIADLSAEQLQTLLRSIIVQTLTDLEQMEKMIINDIFKQIKNLQQVRNDLIHRMWHVEWGTPGEVKSDVHSYKVKKTKEGFTFKGGAETLEVLNDMIVEETHILWLVERLWVLMMPLPPDKTAPVFDKQFVTENGTIRCAPKVRTYKGRETLHLLPEKVRKIYGLESDSN